MSPTPLTPPPARAEPPSGTGRHPRRGAAGSLLLVAAVASMLGGTPARAADPPRAAPDGATTSADRRPPRPLGAVIGLADPTRDGAWTTESFSDQAQGQLNVVADAIKHGMTGEDRAALAAIAAADFSGTALRPDERPAVFTDATMAVRRAVLGEPQPTSAGSLADRVAEITGALEPRPGVSHAKIKIVRVDPGEATITTLVYFEASRSGLQINATWDAVWTAPISSGEGGGDGESGGAEPVAPVPLLSSLRLLSYEETEAQLPPGSPLFTDCTTAVFGGLDAYGDQLAYGANHWHGNLDAAFGVNQGNQGLSLGDVDGDGLEDLYLCQPAGLPNRLFVRRADGTLEDRSAASGLDVLDLSRSAVFADFDNDGDQDCALAHHYSVSIFANGGGGKFTRTSTLDTFARISGLAAADFDHDGDLDLYACGYNPKGQMGPTDVFANPVPYHDAENGGPNYLLRNDGGLVFSDATADSGLGENNSRYSFAAGWEDFDNDGDQDLYVANDFGRNNLYRNNLVPTGTATFEDVAAGFAAEDVAAGMAVAWGDYNNDGNPDLYVSNMWSSAGNRVSFQRQFKPGADPATLALLQRHARGNTLFENPGGGQAFRDVSVEADVTMGRWAWGSLFADINNDGWEDIYVVNGFMTSSQSGDL